jgi:hypothetical protein
MRQGVRRKIAFHSEALADVAAEKLVENCV